MSILFDESEFQPPVNFSGIVSSDDIRQNHKVEKDLELTHEEELLLQLFRKIKPEQRRQILSQIRHFQESADSVKKINLLKAIEESKHTIVNENLSDIIKDVVK
jgi:hypothetical protein